MGIIVWTSSILKVLVNLAIAIPRVMPLLSDRYNPTLGSINLPQPGLYATYSITYLPAARMAKPQVEENLKSIMPNQIRSYVYGIVNDRIVHLSRMEW